MKIFDLPPLWLLGFAVIAYVQGHHYDAGLSLAHPVTMLIAGLAVGGGIVLEMRK